MNKSGIFVYERNFENKELYFNEFSITLLYLVFIYNISLPPFVIHDTIVGKEKIERVKRNRVHIFKVKIDCSLSWI